MIDRTDLPTNQTNQSILAQPVFKPTRSLLNPPLAKGLNYELIMQRVRCSKNLQVSDN